MCALCSFVQAYKVSFPRRLSSVLSKFSHKNILGQMSPPTLEGVTRGGPLPLVTPLHTAAGLAHGVVDLWRLQLAVDGEPSIDMPRYAGFDHVNETYYLSIHDLENQMSYCRTVRRIYVSFGSNPFSGVVRELAVALSRIKHEMVRESVESVRSH